MTEVEVKKAKEEFLDLIKETGAWYDICEKNSPGLKDVEITIKLRVTEK